MESCAVVANRLAASHAPWQLSSLTHAAPQRRKEGNDHMINTTKTEILSDALQDGDTTTSAAIVSALGLDPARTTVARWYPARMDGYRLRPAAGAAGVYEEADWTYVQLPQGVEH